MVYPGKLKKKTCKINLIMDQDNVQKEKSKVIIYREKYTQGKSLHSFI